MFLGIKVGLCARFLTRSRWKTGLSLSSASLSCPQWGDKSARVRRISNFTVSLPSIESSSSVGMTFLNRKSTKFVLGTFFWNSKKMSTKIQLCVCVCVRVRVRVCVFPFCCLEWTYIHTYIHAAYLLASYRADSSDGMDLAGITNDNKYPLLIINNKTSTVMIIRQLCSDHATECV